jgi:hypothetical protein
MEAAYHDQTVRQLLVAISTGTDCSAAPSSAVVHGGVCSEYQLQRTPLSTTAGKRLLTIPDRDQEVLYLGEE